ncbi:MAG: GNAT family N-acetyltransferase [Actinomycetales bacterium]|nr:GNAT family N-acetyltransferase [Actinomycetales bacterium]
MSTFEGDDLVLHLDRLDLHTVLPSEFELLAVDRADPRLWADRGFANPLGHLVDDPGPLPYRLPRIEADPAAAPYLLRMAVLRQEAIIVGSCGFHMLPDDDGMIEIGLGVVEAYRGRGLAQEMLHGMWRWVIDQPGVRTLRYTVSPDNAPSQAIIRKLGFAYCGQQQDEVDGPEDIFEMSAEEYRRHFVRG